MKIEQLKYHSNEFYGNPTMGQSAQWVLVFGDGMLMKDEELMGEIKKIYPKAYVMGCSTAGEIHDSETSEQSLSITAVEFEKSRIEFKSMSIDNRCSFEVGEEITSQLKKDNLKHIFVLCEGLNINGSKLVEGIRRSISTDIPITGGLAGDGSSFLKTYVLSNDYGKQNQIVLAAMYGDIKSSCASYGGWDTFGIERMVTKARDNILYEMDGKPALDLYKEYLGEKAEELPSSGLLFPLNIRINETNQTYVRTLLAVNEEEKSLIFAGDIPVNSFCRLMKSNTNNLINGSLKAAEIGKSNFSGQKIDLAILISCVGRKLVLKQRVDEEVEVVRELLGSETKITGFYSYGEIAPYTNQGVCELHNQTMTVTFLTEE